MKKRLQAAGLVAHYPLHASAEALEERRLLTAWFVSTTGNAHSAGTLASPFATIQQAANVAKPGDTVYIEGGVYHETVTPAHSGTAAAPITYEPYNGESVTIDGADPITGWTQYNKTSIYSAPQSWDLGEGNNQVFVDGVMVNEGRWPNSSLNVSTPTWATASSVKLSISNTGGLSQVTIYNSGLTQAAGAWVGSVAHIEAGEQWVDQTGLVVASGTGWITVAYDQTDDTDQVPQAGNPFYIVGGMTGVDTAGTWYRDPTNNRLYLWNIPDSKGTLPTQQTIEAKARLYAFNLSDLSYINVQGIDLFACTIDTDVNSSHIVLNHITAQYVSQSIGITPDNQIPWNTNTHDHTTGIIFDGTDSTIENSVVEYSSGDGIFLGGSGNTAENDTIHDVDYEAGDEAPITVMGADESALYNTIYNAGRSGIDIRSTTASLISHNVIHNIGLQTTDLGGIYTYGDVSDATEISYNIVYNVHTGGFGAAGVYLDNFSQDFIVDHNVVYNCDFALKLNPPSWNNLIVNNTFVGTQYGLQSSGNEQMTGTDIVNNIFVGPTMIGSTAAQSNNLFSPTNPDFVSTAASDYQLLAASPAINKGKVVAPYTNGYVGSAPDIGAYEYGKAAFTAGATVVAPAAVPAATTTAPAPVAAPVAAPANSIYSQTFNPQIHGKTWGVINSGSGIQFIYQWAYVEYANVNFGAGVDELIAHFSSLPTKSVRIQLRIGSPSATPIANLVIPAKGASTSTASTTVSSKIIATLSGVQTVYLTLIDPPAGGVLSSFTFT